MGIKSMSGAMDTEVTGVQYDSRRVMPGEIFVALPGEHHDGMEFVSDAIARGAAAIAAEGPVRPQAIPAEVSYLGVSDARAALAWFASSFHGRPSDKIPVVGITGTNGKTTTAFLVRTALMAMRSKVGMVGTVRYMVGEEMLPAAFTTPEAPEYQGLLARMHEAGCDYVVSEVSSHALAQRRVDGTRFKVGVFMNLTPEHLDFHLSMDEYFQAKSRLFTEMLDGPAVINIDDPYGRKLVEMIDGPVITFSVEGKADLSAHCVSSSPSGLSFEVRHSGGSRQVDTRLVGRPNISNMLAATGVCVALGIDIDDALTAMESAEPVEGRFMKVDAGQDFMCLVDYAHTGDALTRLLESARELTPEGCRVITVFGCGGDRDRGKRPVMGKAATMLSDKVFITSDNPRGEEPGKIISEIVKGAVKDNYLVVPDRAEAIRAAISEAHAGDTVLIAGKGHEEYQLVGDVRERFSDAEEAMQAIRKRRQG